MKKLAITGERQAKIVRVADPTPKDDWVVVKVHAAPMCAEFKDFDHGRRGEHLGHEAAGEVVAVAQPGRVRVGDRVVVMPSFPCGKCELCLTGNYIYCRSPLDFKAIHGSLDGSGTMAQYLLQRDWLLVPIPDGMTYEHASMACCGLGPSFEAFEQMQVDAYDTVLITGLGPVGLGAVINATQRGARVIAVASNPYRAQVARDLGAALVFDQHDPDVRARIIDATKGKGVDKSLDCAGAVQAHRLCIETTRRVGKVAFVGESSADTPMRVSPDLIRKGLQLMGVWHYNLGGTPKMMRTIQQASCQIDRLISHTFSLDEAQAAFETQLTRQSAKVVLKPWNESSV
jgi:L-iditol 2-dehydrogenase